MSNSLNLCVLIGGSSLSIAGMISRGYLFWRLESKDEECLNLSLPVSVRYG